MKFIQRLPLRVIALSLGLLIFSGRSSFVGGLVGDPSNDFGFHFAHTRISDVYTEMSERQVEKILRDRLDSVPTSQVRPLARHLIQLCSRYRFDPAFILSLIQVESHFRTRVVSPAGAMGLMQLMPATARHVAKKHGIRYSGAFSLYDPFVNLSLGMAYLNELRAKYSGLSPYYHIAAYNVGPARMDQLIARGNFKAVQTKKYYEDILKGVRQWRYYGLDQKWASRI